MVNQKILPEEIFEKREQLGLNNSVKMLSEIIDSEKDEKIRLNAINYLGQISTDSREIKQECFETLENILISEDNNDMKCMAARALGKMQYEKALKPLRWVMEQESTEIELRIASLKAIANVGIKEPEIKLFINELGNKNKSIKNFVRNQIISLDPEISIKLLIKSLNNEDISTFHKTEIIDLIGLELSSINVTFEDSSFIKIKHPDIFTNLKENKKILLENITSITIKDKSDLLNNILVIFKILGEEINQDLIKLLLIDDFIVKKNATKLIGKLKLHEAVDFLITNLDNIYNEVSIATIEALGEIGNISAVPDLLNVLNIEDISYEYLDIDMKFYILDAVKNIYLNSKETNFDDLLSYIQTDNDTIKECVAFILGEIAEDTFVSPLLKLLKEKNLDVKKNSIIALGKIGNLEAIEPLISTLDEKYSYWLIKKVAVDAIYNIFHKNSYLLQDERKETRRLLIQNIENLIDHLANKEKENFKVKLSLIKFLEEFGGETALKALVKRVNDFHRVVRIYASNAIKKIEERLELEEK